jgi:hypothetical protein
MSEEQKPTKKKPPIKFLLTAFVFLVLGGVIAGGVVFGLARTNPNVLGIAATVTITQEEEDKQLLASLSTIMDLPEDDTPTITTVSDAEKAKSDAFFKNAKDGDKVVYFTKSRRVILYRPDDNKIIDVGFIASTPTPAPTAAPVATAAPVPQTIRFFIFNGTSALGATKNIETKLKEVYQSAEILGRTAASKTTYTDSIVVDLTGGRAEDTKKIADALGISVGTLPETEKAPDNSDFLVIVGKNSLPTTPASTSSATPTR